ncbi:DeoR faimly transcriptional regulator [Mangrovibacter sp. MFB070]|uniref:MocR-like transcription factor YczR n=1 Tax=Mangrovibacter sp. MFB070 TaxID=1224318 RepID=UPI0004D5B8AE|nr:PLP-dependent aminotransferase family protein [Mangrovibacter sp. MFB070]KEA52180.1 DeoR faimly transcriptional regulator [Mangrovibacter sp. MFB070]
MTQRQLRSASLLKILGQWHHPDTRIPVYRQLAEGLRLLILDGRLPLNSRLPGERELADSLALSRTTVANALNQLREEGYLQSRQGSGSVTRLPDTQVTQQAYTVPGDTLDLATAALPASPAIHQAYQRAITGLTEHLGSTGYDSQGLPRLRTAIARHYCQRGLATTPDQIMVVNGAVSGLALLLRLFTGPGDRVLVDHPTYPMALDAIRGASCRPVGVSLPANEGWDCDGFAATLAQTSPRLAYLIPDFHNPTGRCMSLAERQSIAAIAQRSHTPLVVDETMAELWYDAPPPPPLACFGDAENIISLGSCGKSFWGGLRLGWIRTSPGVIARLVQQRNTLDLGSPLLEQLTAAILIEEEEAILQEKRHQLRVQRDQCLALIQSYFPHWQTTPPPGGLSLWVTLPSPAATRFAASAENIGIHLGPGPRFGIDGAFERFLRLPFTLETVRMEMALMRLLPVWQQLALVRSPASNMMI